MDDLVFGCLLCHVFQVLDKIQVSWRISLGKRAEAW